MKTGTLKVFSPIALALSCVISIFALASNASAAVLPLLNPGFEDQGESPERAASWNDFGIGYARTSQMSHSGTWSIGLRNMNAGEMAGAWQRIDLNQSVEKPVLISGYISGANIRTVPGSFIGASIYAEIHLQDGTVAYWNSLQNYGTFSWRWIGFNTATLASVNQPIEYIFIVPIIAEATGIAYFDDISVQEFDPAEGAVTLMFDDGWQSTAEIAAPLLKENGFPGVVAAVTNYLGIEPYMSRDALKDLAAKNWEVVSHGTTHGDLTKMSKRNALRELTGSKALLKELGIDAKHFAFPFGAYNSEVLYMGVPYYESLRAFETGENSMGAFPLDIKVRDVRIATTPADVSHWVNQAKESGTWAVIVFHDISDTGDDEFHTPVDTFRDMIRAVKESGVSVITYNEGIQQYGAKK